MCNFLLVDVSNWNIDCKESGQDGHAKHHVDQIDWEVDDKWVFHEQEELCCDCGCNYKTDNRSQEERTDDNRVLLVHE